jgi:hypothetical protein
MTQRLRDCDTGKRQRDCVTGKRLRECEPPLDLLSGTFDFIEYNYVSAHPCDADWATACSVTIPNNDGFWIYWGNYVDDSGAPYVCSATPLGTPLTFTRSGDNYESNNFGGGTLILTKVTGKFIVTVSTYPSLPLGEVALVGVNPLGGFTSYGCVDAGSGYNLHLFRLFLS